MYVSLAFGFGELLQILVLIKDRLVLSLYVL